MDLIQALTLSIGILGGALTWLLGGPLSGSGLQIWCAFLGWASFFSAGGTEKALAKSIAGNVWGILWGTLAFIALAVMHVSSPAMVGVIVCISIFLLIPGAYYSWLDVIPAQFYGYSAVAGFIILKNASALDFNFVTGPFTMVCLSMILGNLFGYASGKIAAAIAKK